jgi:hypothetical protein
MPTNPLSCVRRTLLSAALIGAGVFCPSPLSHPPGAASVAHAAAAASQLRIRDLAGVKIVQQAVEFPSRANELNGKPVEVNGFMIPLGMGEGKLKKFVLIEVPLSCCFADGPGIDQMIFVSLAPGKELDYASDFPVTVTGRFQAGVQKNQYGQVESLYRIVGASARKIGE